jgi:hypothetical protein
MDDTVDTPNIDPFGGGTGAETLRRAIGERYLTYALSTIMHRALPDARDGLKPVHRRILYAMRELRLSSTGGFRKSAKISGDVMGNYHPHGDAAIYDAMARLAQDFNVRYPLVDGQGNFGNIDGDNPAASRYTEARMTVVAEALLNGLDENAVDFRDNYDGTLTEPVVLPASFQPSGQWRGGHRRGHGHQHPAAQYRRAVRCLPAPDQDARRARRHALELRARPGFPDRRRDRRTALKTSRRPIAPGAGVPPALPLGDRGSGPRSVADRRHRNPLPGAEIQADRKDRRPHPDQERSRSWAMCATSPPTTSA